MILNAHCCQLFLDFYFTRRDVLNFCHSFCVLPCFCFLRPLSFLQCRCILAYHLVAMLSDFSLSRLRILCSIQEQLRFVLHFSDFQQFFQPCTADFSFLTFSECHDRHAGVSLFTQVPDNCQVAVVLHVPPICFFSATLSRDVRLSCPFDKT